jgi:hypothetical protein
MSRGRDRRQSGGQGARAGLRILAQMTMSVHSSISRNLVKVSSGRKDRSERGRYRVVGMTDKGRCFTLTQSILRMKEFMR